MKKFLLIFLSLILTAQAFAKPSQTNYQKRLQQVLHWADTTNAGNFLIAGAKINTGNDLQKGLQIFERELKRKDNSHRGMFVIYEMMTAYLAAEKNMPKSLKKKVRDYLAVANFYRGDTENHLTMYYTGLYLAAQTFPNLPAEKWYTGKSSEENKQEAKTWLDEWMRLTTTIGQGEFDSPTYMVVFISPMFSLYQWAKDPAVKQNALAMLHWLIADYAVEHLDGVYIGAHSREYPDRIIQPKHKYSNMTSWGWLLFGQTGTSYHSTLLTAVLSDFDLPDVLYNIGTDRSQPYAHTETKRIRHIIRLGEEKNPPVYKYSYLTEEYGLGSMMGGTILQPIQQHNWDVSFKTDSPFQTIFTVHPYVGTPDLGKFFPEEMKFSVDEVTRFHTYYGSEDKWVSSSPYEQTFQHENAIIVLYNISEEEQYSHIDGFFPKDLERRETDDSGWIFCQGGKTYIAYFPLKPYEWIEEKDCFRLRSYELQNGCIVEVGQADDYSSFSSFKNQIKNNTLVNDTFDQSLTVSYSNSNHDVLTFTYNGARRINGKLIDFEDYKLFHGPFLNSEVGSRKLEILYKEKGIMIDFATDEKAHLLPIYMCEKVKNDFELDSKEASKIWENVQSIKLLDAITGKEGRFSTNVQVLYSDNFLYVKFVCEDDYIWGTVKERNGEIYNEECVEVFLNPANCTHQYYELNLSPKNVAYDACVINGRTPEKPNEAIKPLFQMNIDKMKTFVTVEGDLDVNGKGKSWQAYYAIPFDELFGAENVPPKVGDTWRANFYRIDSPKAGHRDHYAWSKTERPAFHLPWRFGYLKFGE
jgi:hypothetical protein